MSANLPALRDEDYDAIEAAVMETARGRWFLEEYARRNRQADTLEILAVLDRLERMIRRDRAVSDIDRIRLDLADMARAIDRARDDIAGLTEETSRSPADRRTGHVVATFHYLDRRLSALRNVWAGDDPGESGTGPARDDDRPASPALLRDAAARADADGFDGEVVFADENDPDSLDAVEADFDSVGRHPGGDTTAECPFPASPSPEETSAATATPSPAATPQEPPRDASAIFRRSRQGPADPPSTRPANAGPVPASPEGPTYRMAGNAALAAAPLALSAAEPKARSAPALALLPQDDPLAGYDATRRLLTFG